MMRHVRGTALLLLAAALLPWDAAAQRRGGGNRAQLEERVRAEMARVTRERLGLDEAEAQELSEVMQSFESRRRELFAEEQATRLRVEAVLRGGGSDQDEARDVITRMWELRGEEVELFREEQEALLDVLTPVQLLRLQELRQDFGRRIRALGGGRGGRGGAPGGGGSAGRPGGPRGPSGARGSPAPPPI
jgi:Spy/CpxP family protein refolding chaperone